MHIQMVATDQLVPYVRNARTHGKKQISQIARSIETFGFNNPLLVDQTNNVIAGHGRLLAAISLGMDRVPAIQLSHMTQAEIKAYILADNKLAEKAGWDKSILKIELENLMNLNIDLTSTGFETPEIDLIINNPVEVAPSIDEQPVESQIQKQVRFGDLWRLGRHLLFCGDALNVESFEFLLGNDTADLIFTDPPYNVKVHGHVCGSGKIKHKEFAYASGEMSEKQFTDFLEAAFRSLCSFSKSGSIHYICMDWRHVLEVMDAASTAYTECKNICVWNKQAAGMGSLYRSQHEFVFVYKNGCTPHVNNIELGKHGRYRTNIWDYPGIQAGQGKDLVFHPTVKPVGMIIDAILDCSKQNDIVLDCFGGSGSTLLAAEKTRRRARLIELEPEYCDVILHRFEKLTGIKPEKLLELGDV